MEEYEIKFYANQIHVNSEDGQHKAWYDSFTGEWVVLGGEKIRFESRNGALEKLLKRVGAYKK